MYQIKRHPEFAKWFEALPDKATKATLTARIDRLERGLMGDVEPVGNGVSELRVHIGPGWRIYFIIKGRTVVILLCGGTKRTQNKDISQAKGLAEQFD